ncbi:hypothetical protein NQ318_001631 [Aromia moschata]|uniref:Uncharacterized protein n=1 Tax=Aromia moschata TaxID=1265417 RepID=A0AAV8Y1R7_9CUCU|nr:hypothetical protein NQ318_001631 [Aromia moschata]
MKSLRSIAYEYANLNNIDHPFDTQNRTKTKKDKVETELEEKRRKEKAKRSAKKGIGIRKKISCANQKRSSEIYECPACCEKYSDPPTEDWIQCQICKEFCPTHLRLLPH